MKKNVKEFINYLEKETTITFDLSSVSPTQKLRNAINQPIRINVFSINYGLLGLAIISCGCKSCKEIIGVEILYGPLTSEYYDAKNVQSQIKAAVPSLSVELRNVNQFE
jgi:hypothetical protein